MQTRLIILSLFILFAVARGYSQKVNGKVLEVPTTDGEKLTGEVLTVDMYDKDCIHVVDGLISSFTDVVPQQQLAHFEQAVSKEKLEKLGFNGRQCVMVKSTADLDIENYIFRQVNDKVRQIGIQYKVPIVVNGKLLPSYNDRRDQLSKLKAEQVKKIKFLNKAEAQAKYGDKVVFGLIEITV